MYTIIFVKGCSPGEAVTGSIISTHPTLEAAAASRVVSGDLIMDEGCTVIDHDSWLFNWEKADKNCYAQRMRGANLTETVFQDCVLKTQIGKIKCQDVK